MIVLSYLLLVGSVTRASAFGQHASNPQHEARQLLSGPSAQGRKGVFFMNRIAPVTSDLYIANADGSNERRLFGSDSSTFDYHASFSPDGESVIFTTERNGDGNADVYRACVDGTHVEKLVSSPSFEGQGAMSPDNKKLAFVSTANGYKANVWVHDLETGVSRNLTNTDIVRGVSWSPDGYFRPAWSPKGDYIVFSSDRNTEWLGHDNGTGWEHTQELSIYSIRADGSDFRRVVTRPGYALGSPKFSPDGTRVVYYEISRQGTWDAHRPERLSTVESQVVSVDFVTGESRVQHTSGPGLKISPQILSDNSVGYLTKGTSEGLNYTTYTSTRKQVLGSLRNPAWSPDSKLVVYEKTEWKPNRQLQRPLWSWQADWEYRFTDVFPTLSEQGIVAETEKQLGNSSIVTMTPDGLNKTVVFDVPADEVDPSLLAKGLGGAFQPSWSPDGTWLTFGVGKWFQTRTQKPYAKIYRSTADGKKHENLTDGSVHSGFPSYSPDGKSIVFREFGGPFGLKIIDLEKNNTRVLTQGWDNLPDWSKTKNRIVFTRRTNETNFDVCTINPDGSDLRILTTSGANDAHAVWTYDGRIAYNSGEYGFRDECATYDQTFQPYGQIMIMNDDGSNKAMLTDSMWEDSMPMYVPNEYLK